MERSAPCSRLPAARERRRIRRRSGWTGTWAGTVPFALPAGDWSSATLTLTQSEQAVSGTITSRDGVAYAVRGTFGETAAFGIEGLGTALCPGVSLTADSFVPRGIT